jgi:hypothetical protein
MGPRSPAEVTMYEASVFVLVLVLALLVIDQVRRE